MGLHLVTLTTTYSVNWVFTLGYVLNVNQLSCLLCRRLANTGSTVAMSWLYKRRPLTLSMACFMRSVNWWGEV